MSFFVDFFTKADVARSLGQGWTVRTTGTSDATSWRILTNQAQGRGTSNKRATATGLTQVGDSSFARVVLPGTNGASTSVGVNCVFENDTPSGTGPAIYYRGYTLRHTGSALEITRQGADAYTTMQTVTPPARAAGDELVITTEHANGQVIIKGWVGLAPVDTTTTAPTITATDLVPITGGKPMLHHQTTDGVLFDNFRGGDLADMAAAMAATDSTLTAGGTVQGQSTVITPLVADPLGVVRWRGLSENVAAERMLPGVMTHRRSWDFLAAGGVWTPPEGLVLTGGTAAIISPEFGVGALQLTTDATAGAAAGIATAFSLATTEHRAILWEVHGLHWTVGSPPVDLVLGLDNATFAGGGATQRASDAQAYLFSSGVWNLAETGIPVTRDGSLRRRSLGVLLIPDTQEVGFLVDGAIVGRRDASATWTHGLIRPSLRFANSGSSAVSVSGRCTSVELTTWS